MKRLQYIHGFIVNIIVRNIQLNMHTSLLTNVQRSTFNVRHILFITAILLLCSCGAERNISKGEKNLALGEYYDAAEQFKQAYSKTDTKNHERRGKISLRMALCYDKMNATSRAIASYRNAERYGKGNAAVKLALARLLMKSGDYKEATKAYEEANDSMPGNILAINGLTSSKEVAKWKKAGSRYTVKRVDILNSRRADYSPMLLGDENNLIYFSSTRNEATGNDMSSITGTKAADIFYSEKDNKGNWGRPQIASGGINTDYEEGACCFSPDSRTMYLTQCLVDPTFPRYAQIATSERSDAAWGKATALQITRDTLSDYAHPAVSPDGQWLYFTSDMPGGIGGLDIWRVRITAAGLGGVENLGEPINTPGNEEFPTFRPNGDLYFSSDGHEGLGGLDIFIAKPDNNNKYILEHPGFPLNSDGDDFGMTFEGAANKGYFSSNRGDANGWDHIYSFNNPEITNTVKGWVYEIDGYELPAAQIYIIGSDGTNTKSNVLSDGSFSYEAKPDVDYLFLAACKGFLNHKEEIRMEQKKESQLVTLQFPLASITAPVLIDNIFYDFDKATLRPESTKALDELVKLLNENPHVTIELSSHCDYKGSADYNKKLSQRRAESVVAYLINHGIASDRLTAMGYGKEQPKVIRKKLTEKYLWLHEGDTLTVNRIKVLPADQQEICNQLNRRTEFRVLRTTYGLFDEKGQLKKQAEKPKTTKKEDDNSLEITF